MKAWNRNSSKLKLQVLTSKQKERLIKFKELEKAKPQPQDTKRPNINKYNVPKKPANPFMLYMHNTFFKQQQQDGSATQHRDMIARAAHAWNALPSAEQDIYKQEYLRSKQAYQIKYDAAMAHHVPRPANPYLLYLHDYLQEQRKTQNPLPAHTQLVANASKLWKSMSEEQKQTYRDQYIKLKLEFLTAKQNKSWH